MNKLTKLGLTAVAGSLVASSAYAGALDVSGSAKFTYKSQDEDEVTGNSFSMNQKIYFSGGGELDNGMSVSYGHTMATNAFSSQVVALDMGDAGTLGMSNSGAVGGMLAYQSVIPHSGEQVWDDMNNNDNGITSWNNLSDTNLIYYTNSVGDIGVNLAYNNRGKNGSSDHHGVATYSGVDGLTLGAGMGTQSGNTDTDMTTLFAKYTMGSITAAYQRTELDLSGSASDEESDSIGVGFAVNENLSVSVGRTEVDLGPGKTDEESTGVSASYTMGSMSITAISNSQDDVGGTGAAKDSYKEVTIGFAF